MVSPLARRSGEPAALVLASALAFACAPTARAQRELQLDFGDGVARTWVGPELYADRLQDWRVRGGRLECTENAKARPLRVAHLLTAAVGPGRGVLRTVVTTGPLDAGSAGAPGLHGFLLGAGGPHVDYRLTALCHHRPAEDGGIVCAVDDAGRVVFRDNETNVVLGGWAITGELHTDELREIPATRREGRGRDGARVGAVELELCAEPVDATGDAFRLTLTARAPGDHGGGDGGDDGAGPRVLSRAILEPVDARLVDGGLGLVSHHGTGYWFDDWRVSGSLLERHPERAFGPVLGVQYTLSRGTLKLTAQMPPLGPDDARQARLQLQLRAGAWRDVATAELAEPSNTFAFRVERFPGAGRDVPCRVVYALRTGPDAALDCAYQGLIRAEPADGEVVIAAFTGDKHFTGGIRWNHDGLWFPHRDIVAAVSHHDPDLLFFSGDQLYESDLTGAQRRPLDAAMLDYHDKWLRWVWAFGALTRDRPTVTIPDDHDVYHGNIWGAGGRAAQRADDGGYTMPAEFVRMVETTQTSHLPDPFDPTPVEQGIGVYYTDLRWGGVSFAILEDRKFKSSPTVAVPDGRCVNGWFQEPGFDPIASADVAGAVLLGDRQLGFLEHWAADWSGGVWMKAVLSQTIFANVATLPRNAGGDGVVPGLELFAPGEYAPDDARAADADSNGWPQTGRDEALRRIRKAFAVHVAGDQHLASMIRYGIDDWDDAGFALCVPSIANTWPRRWFPPPDEGRGREPGSPAYAGRFKDGFGNAMTVYAVANPVQSGREPRALHDRQPGYGIVRFSRAGREITLECWPRWSDPARPDAEQYPGWPKTVRQADNYARTAVAWLPEIQVIGMTDPVLRVIDERDGETVYTLRIEGDRFAPPVFQAGFYTVWIGEPGTPRARTLQRLRATAGPRKKLQIRL